MAVVAKYGVWDNATYPWADTTSAGLIGTVVTEIDAWITAISGNASITANGMLPVKKRDHTSSANSGVRNGFVYEFPDTSIGLNKDGPTYPTLGYYGTETSTIVRCGDEYEDTTANDGYGNWGTTPGRYTTITRGGAAGYSKEAIIAYETTDGEEFFAFGVKQGSSSSHQTSFIAFKDTDGHWCFDVSSYGFAYDNALQAWQGETGPNATTPRTLLSSNSYSMPLGYYASGATSAASHPNYGTGPQGLWFAASSKLYEGRSTNSSFGQYVNIGSEQLLILSYIGNAVIIPA